MLDSHVNLNIQKYYLLAFSIHRANRYKVSEDFRQLYGSIVAKKGRVLPDYADVRYNASLMLGNSDVITGDSIPLPENYKHIGGYHIKDTAEPLSKV